jgi:RNA polymerase sigma-70 factor, ECF subfamily
MVDYKSIEEIIESYNSRIHNVIKRFLPTENDVEDVKQEVYIKTWKNISKYRGDASLWGWINKITVNTCKDHLRSGKKFQIVDSEDGNILQNIPDKNPSPDKSIVFTERHRLILDSINKLSPKLREVVILYDIEELNYEEIAEKIKRPVGTVKSRLFNARKALKEELKPLLN